MPIPRSMMGSVPPAGLDLRLVAGTWPEGLEGELFVSTAEQATAGRHAFFGDGVMARLSLRPGTFGARPDRWAWRSTVLGTPSRRLREAVPEAFTAGAYGTTSPFGFSNAANTAPLPWGDRLFATWDAGRPVEVDPLSLSSLGEVGHRCAWPAFVDAPVLPFVASSAHPVVDPDRDCLWTVAHDPVAARCWVVRWTGADTRVDAWPVDGAAVPQSMHTVSQTRDWLVLVDCAFRADPNELFGTGERTTTTLPDAAVHLVRKEALEATAPGAPVAATTVQVGPETNHFSAVYDDADGVRILFEHTVDTDLAMALRAGDVDALGRPIDPALVGLYVHPASPGLLTVVDVDPEAGSVHEHGRAVDRERWWATQLSAVDWSAAGLARPTVHHEVFGGYRPEAVVQRHLDLYAGRVDPAALPGEEVAAALVTFGRDDLDPRAEHRFGLDDYPTSPCFVPRPSADPGASRYEGADPGGHDGWVVLPVLNDDGFRVEVFDASDVGAGPVAVLASPSGETMPFLIHTAWMPRAVAPDPGIERLAFADELDDDRLAGLPTDLAEAARQVARDLAEA